MSALEKLRSFLGEAPHAYLPNILTFLPLDQNKVKDDLKIEPLAIERGSAGLPPSDSDAFDDVENAIVLYVETEKTRWHNQFLDQLSTFHRRLADLDIEARVTQVSSAAREATGEFKARIHEGRDALVLLRRSVRDSERHLQAFQKRNGLIRPAHYPSSYWLTGGLVGILFLLEALLNGSLLGKGHEGGYIGGFGEAIAIAFVNIIISLGVGFVFARFIAYRNLAVRLLAVLVVIGYAGMDFMFNVLIGHYREELGGVHPEVASQAALHAFQTATFEISDLISWVMVVVGVAFALFAILDGWRMDDPYPQYGAIDRRHEKRVAAYANKKSELLNGLRDTRDYASKAFEDFRLDLLKRRGEHDAILHDRTRLINGFNAHLKYLESAGNELLALYRAKNRMSRPPGSPTPPHFNKAWSMDKPSEPIGTPVAVPPERMIEALKVTDATVQSAIREVHDAFDLAVTQYDQVDRLVEEAQALNAAA